MTWSQNLSVVLWWRKVWIENFLLDFCCISLLIAAVHVFVSESVLIFLWIFLLVLVSVPMVFVFAFLLIVGWKHSHKRKHINQHKRNCINTHNHIHVQMYANRHRLTGWFLNTKQTLNSCSSTENLITPTKSVALDAFYCSFECAQSWSKILDDASSESIRWGTGFGLLSS